MTTIDTPKLGDNCPSCGGEFVEVPAPSDAQRAAAANKDNPASLPAGTDSATVEQRAELGALYKCGNCGYTTRMGAGAAAGDNGNGGDGAGEKTGAGRRGRKT